MKRAVIFGSTNTGQTIYKKNKDDVQVIAFLDEDSDKWGGTTLVSKFARRRIFDRWSMTTSMLAC